MDHGGEAGVGFVVACCDAAKLFEIAEEVFHQMAPAVHCEVAEDRVFAVGLGRDNRRLAGLGERLEHPRLGIERLVGDQRVGGKVGQQGVGALQIMRLPRREREPSRVAERVNRGVDLGAQAAPAAANGFIASGFLAAPALC